VVLEGKVCAIGDRRQERIAVGRGQSALCNCHGQVNWCVTVCLGCDGDQLVCCAAVKGRYW